MAETDNPLKMLIVSFSGAYARWLLGSPVQQVRPLNVELPASATVGDLLFEVITDTDQVVLLHIELQGPRSHLPMPYRELDYMARILIREAGQKPPSQALRLHSVVIYVGQGAGANDTGAHEILGIDGLPRLSWRYDVIRLWEMEAAELLTLGEPAFLPLVGQTKIKDAKQIVPQVVAQIHGVDDEGQRKRLITALINLISDEEMIQMVEQMLDSADEILLNTPYLRRMREQIRREISAESLAALRKAVAEVVAMRFNPPVKEYLQVEQKLQQCNSLDALERLHTAAVEAEDLPAFAAILEAELANEQQPG